MVLLVSLLLLSWAIGVGTAAPGFEEDLVLDPAGTEAEFGRIADVVVASDGTVYVADSGFGRIHAFDDAGRFLRSFGAVGEGPGDLPQRFFRMAIDHDDRLLLAGNRSAIGWLSGQGDLVRSVERKSTWWNPREHRPQWASALVSGTAALTPDEEHIVFVQSGPFELRLYDLEGELVRQTTQSAGDFVPEPRLPEVDGDRTTFRSWGGSGPPLVAPDGRIFVRASRVHPEDDDLSRWNEPDFELRWLVRQYVYSPRLELLAEMNGDDLPRPLAFDPRGRLWCLGPGDLPTLIRFRVVWEE